MTGDPQGELDLDLTPDGVAFWIHVTPRARRAGVGGVHAGALRVAVTAAPVAGKATAACVQAIAQALELPKSAVTIDPASRHRRKRVTLAGPAEPLASSLRALASSGRLR